MNSQTLWSKQIANGLQTELDQNGYLSTDGSKWISSRKNFFLPVRVLSRLYRRLILEGLAKLHKAGKLHFFGDHAELDDRATFDTFLQPLRKIDWVVIVP